MSSSGWLSLLPALITIAVALFTHRVALAIMMGVCTGIGAIFYVGDEPLSDIASRFGLACFTDMERLEIGLFLFLIGALLHVLSQAGAYKAFSRHIVTWLTTPFRTRFATFGVKIGRAHV